ncbi:MAG: glycosyltransferase family 39 protein [Chloroflexi bacterium]|nr:glycosyltransferase family 39 protein [Chloroflexota bacterium]
MTDGTGSTERTAAERVVLAGLLVLAALLRLPDLATRGTWDADQGHDMLVLRAFVRDGLVPLLGPPTSIGDFHHGAWYYYLLSPAAVLTGGDSALAVVVLIALAGVAAVGVTWWLARAMGGPVAGATAGFLMAISIAAIDESTFIWNPNLIALSSSVALAGAWRAWTTRRPRWWLLAAVGTALTMQLHVLSVTLLPVVAALFVADLRRSPAGTGRGSVARMGLVALGILAVAYVPLAVHELTADFSETRAIIDYLAGGAGNGAVALPVRLGIVGLRVVGWPLTGLITAGFLPAVAATALVVGLVAWRWRTRGASSRERVAVRWLGLGLAWSVVALAVVAPSLSTVVAGLPNDHYHAFADPIVFVLVGLGVAGLVHGGGQGGRHEDGRQDERLADRQDDRIARPGLGVAALIVFVLAGWNLTRLPPGVAADGGYPAAESGARRVEAALAAAGVGTDAPVVVRSLPDFKSTEAMAYPLVRFGRRVDAATPQGPAPGSVRGVPAGLRSPLVLLCDDLFAASIGAACGGPAEARITPEAGSPAFGALMDRFEVAPGRFVSVYRPAAP